MQDPTARRLLYFHWVIIKAARSFRGESPDDLVSVGWVSAMARGVPEGARAAQAAYLAATR